MGHQAEVAHGVLVAEGGDGGCQVHHAGNHPAGTLREHAAGQHLVLAVLHHAHVDVQARASLARGNLRGEGDVVAQLIAQVADNPLGQHQLVGSLLHGHGQELYLVLLVVLAVEREVAHLRVAVLNLSACLGDILHAARAEIAALGIGGRLVVAALVLGGKHFLVVADDVVLQLAHGLKLHARHLAEGLGSLVQRVLGRRLQGPPVFVEERAEQHQRGYLGKGVEEGRAEAGQHVEVARTGLDEGEEAAAVDTLAAGEDGVEIVQVVDDEVQRLQLAVAAGIHEVHHADVVLGHVVDDVGLGKLGRWLLECRHDGVSIQNKVIVVHIRLKFGKYHH